jgi:hypothetical protein
MAFRHWLAISAISLASLAPRAADACGGGVAPQDVSVRIAAQRSLISVRDAGTTDVVVQLSVPETATPYGVLIPVAAQPSLDPEPISSDELDTLDAATAPEITVYEGEDTGGGCGCGSAKAGDAAGGRPNQGVNVTSYVEIGPVTAVVLSGTSADAITTWLGDNGFVIPAEHQPVIDSYLTASPWFIAFKRNDSVTDGSATTVGVHYTLQGDHRAYALRMSRVGAAPELAITVFIAAEESSAPASPFSLIQKSELAVHPGTDDPGVVAEAYRSAVLAAVSERSDKAFVLEGVFATDQVPTGPRLATLLDSGHQLTRLTTVVRSDRLDLDVAFTDTVPEPPPPGSGAAAYLPRSDRWPVLALAMMLSLSTALVLRRQRTAPGAARA